MTTNGNLTRRVVRPRFHVYVDPPRKDEGEKDYKIILGAAHDKVSGFVQSRHATLPPNYAHICLSELDELLNIGEGQDFKKAQVLAEVLLAYLLERGVDAKDHQWSLGIWVREGLNLEGETLTVFPNLEGIIDHLSEATFDTTVGYKIKTDLQRVECRKFSLGRLFKRYSFSGFPYRLKQVAWACPDLIEYLFADKEFDELSPLLQQSSFVLPPDLADPSRNFLGCNVWPLALDLSLGFPKPDEILSRSPFYDARVDLHTLALRSLTLSPRQKSCGFHLIVKEKKEELSSPA